MLIFFSTGIDRMPERKLEGTMRIVAGLLRQYHAPERGERVRPVGRPPRVV